MISNEQLDNIVTGLVEETTERDLINRVNSLEHRLHAMGEALKDARRNLSKWREDAAAREQAADEQLMIRYLQFLGYETSNYRTSTSQKCKGRRKLSISTTVFPEGHTPSFDGDIFVQTTLVYGTGAHNVLLKAAKAWAYPVKGK